MKDRKAKNEEIFHQVFREEYGVPDTPQSRLMLNLLGGLGSHDLSVMREALGMPIDVLGASLGFPFWRFDCHLRDQVFYGLTKSQRSFPISWFRGYLRIRY